MSSVFANRTERRDFIVNEFERLAIEESDVYIATAFFTESDVVRRLVDKRCKVHLVVRLGFPTDPDAIARAMGLAHVQLRVYTGTGFHPKLYLFEDAALVGSANLTLQAITTNQEVMVSIDAQDDRFSELVTVFDEYWRGARVPTSQQLKDYRQFYAACQRHAAAIDQVERQVLERLGDHSPANIQRGQKKESKQSVFLESFRRNYQEALAAFEILQRTYRDTGYRKVNESVIPLRLEIDSFISFVRERHIEGESWRQAPLRTPSEQDVLIRGLIDEWRETYWKHFEEDIVRRNFPLLQAVFQSKESVMSADDDLLVDALGSLHSFYERLRFFEGGFASLKREFLAANDSRRVRLSLAHLVFGDGEVEARMADLVFDPSWKLQQFGRSNVQELVGWCNREARPVVNGRTTMVLRYFGSRVTQV